jgi:hypothetical protein
MNSNGFPDLGPEYTGFLHRHPARPGFPEMKSHVVVDLDDWLVARKFYETIKLLRSALIGIVGSSDIDKLKEMESIALELIDEDIVQTKYSHGMLNAIRGLIETNDLE